jgi:hypothetical protein
MQEKKNFPMKAYSNASGRQVRINQPVVHHKMVGISPLGWYLPSRGTYTVNEKATNDGGASCCRLRVAAFGLAPCAFGVLDGSACLRKPLPQKRTNAGAVACSAECSAGVQPKDVADR